MSKRKKTRIVHIFPQNPTAKKKIYEKIRILKYLFPEKLAMKYIAKKYFPNSILISLAKRGKIKYYTSILTNDKIFTAVDARKIPKADIWLFSLINMEGENIYTKEFMQAIKNRSKKLGIRVLQLSSHLDQENIKFHNSPKAYPKIAKLKANGVVIDFKKESFCILKREEEENWQASIGSSKNLYIIQPFLTDDRVKKNLTYYLIERWIVLGNDLTVGIRKSKSPIIKQHNSVTFYRRDARKLKINNEYNKLQDYLKLKAYPFSHSSKLNNLVFSLGLAPMKIL